MLTIEPPKNNQKPLPAHPHDEPDLNGPQHRSQTQASHQNQTQPGSQQNHTVQTHTANDGSRHQAFTLHIPEHHQQSEPEQTVHKVQQEKSSQETAADIIRGKLDRLYKDEPAANAEITAIEQSPGAYSKHQEFVMRLVSTGQPLSEIQSAWHAYYADLPDAEKHEVWQEFYSSYERASKFAQALMARQQGNVTASNSDAAANQTSSSTNSNPHHHATPKRTHASVPHSPGHAEPVRPYSLSPEERIARKTAQTQTIGALKSQLIEKITARSRATKSTHFKSLAFGLGTGVVFLVIVLFSFFNERFITPFIMPGKASASTRLIIDPNQNADVGPESKIIIPKLNVEVPVVYDAESIEEKAIQHALESGVVHYPITEYPGELGNAVIVGHSSNNILNKGKYKFAFLMLKKLEANDTFYIHYNNKRYVYKVYETKIVEATDVSVLEDTDRPATMTLITCDPPGTSVKRLIVRAEQISPEPAGNTASTAAPAQGQPEIVPGNSQSLYQRLTDWIF